MTEDVAISDVIDPLTSLSDAKAEISNHLDRYASVHHGVKWYVTLHVTFVKRNNVGEDVEHQTTFRGEVATMLRSDEFESMYNEQVELIMRRLVEFVQNGSGWTISQVDKIVLSMAAYNPTGGSSYIRTPKSLVRKQAIVNVNNDDNKCFVWAVLSALHPQQQHSDRITKYREYANELNVTGLEFPLTVNDVKKFENLNQTISVNVFAYEEKSDVYPVYVTSVKNRRNHVNLLLLSENGHYHYTWIKNMSRLLHRPDDYHHQKFYCDYCLHGFYAQDILARHVEDCSKFGMQKVVMPKEDDKWVRFQSIQKMLQVPFVIYADFEAYTNKLQNPVNLYASTHQYERHELSGFAYLVVCADPQHKFSPVVYRGPNVVEELLARLKQEACAIHDVLSKVVPMQLSVEEEHDFETAYECYLCEEPLGIDRVRDHCHLTGKYRGAAHSDCNLQLQFKKDKRNNRSVF